VVIKTNPCNLDGTPSNDEDGEAKLFFNVDEVVGKAYVPCEIGNRISLVRGDLNPNLMDAHVMTQDLQHHNKKG